MTMFPRNCVLFFGNILLQNIFFKKYKVLGKRDLYFWITVLPNDDVFGELRIFFQNIFLWNIAIALWNQSISVTTKCAQKHVFFWTIDRQPPDHVCSWAKLHNAAQISVPPNAPRLYKQQRTARLVETRLNRSRRIDSDNAEPSQTV